MSELPSKMPPQNQSAEECVLGSVLRDNDVLSEILQIMRPGEFFFAHHEKIFQAMIDLQHEGKPIDMVILYDVLKSRKQLDEVGGAAFLSKLWDAAPTAANAEYYARIVHDKAVTRHLIHVCGEVLRDAYDGVNSAEELLAGAERKVLEIAEKGTTGETCTLGDTLGEALTRIDNKALKSGLGVSGVPTGFTDLDEKTAGFQNNELVIIAARPSVGKTAFALNIIRHVVVEAKLPVFFVSLEQAKVELAERLLCCQAKVDSSRIRSGKLHGDDTSKLLRAQSLLQGDRRTGKGVLFIDDSPSQTMLRVSANARRLKLRHDIRMVVIDYLQLVEPENRRDPRQEQVAQVSRRLKHLARELKIPVVALAQVNRGSEDRADHRPRLSDLRESGSIEQDADTVLMLHRPGKYESGEDNVIEVNIAKQRNGPTGEVNLTWTSQFMRFENYTVNETTYTHRRSYDPV